MMIVEIAKNRELVGPIWIMDEFFLSEMNSRKVKKRISSSS
jgi:hypothetical protein